MIKCTFENGDQALLRHVVIDAIILKEGKILLVKRAEKLIEGGKWALVGGFVEQNENLKQAAEREILEESGYKVNDLRLFTIIDNPHRKNEDRQNISFVFICESKEKIGESDWEVTEQKWFDVDNLPSEEVAFDHLEIIQLYLRYKKENLKLPIIN